MAQKLTILGAGESGVGAAILGLQKGFKLFVSDMGTIKENFKDELLALGIEFEEGKHSFDRIADSDLVIKSPGIPDKAPVVALCTQNNIPVISEIEFAARYTNAKMICITGSNGKTTTTLLTYEIFKRAGLNVGLAGNVGQSFARQVAHNNFDYYILELSSFQLDGMFEFKADVAILMNITPDHLDRYQYQLQNYVNSKFRIIQNQTADDCFIYFGDDPIILDELSKRSIVSQCIAFSTEKQYQQNGAYILNNKLTVLHNNKLFEMSMYDLALPGKHNACNSMAAAIASNVSGIRNEYIRECLSDFRGVEHRLERYLMVHGVEYINDSKATNINSTWYALESMTNPTVWIVGGVDKGNNYAELHELVKTKVKAIICLGIDNSKIIEAFQDKVQDIVETKSMKHAVQAAHFLAEKGDTVLLSPACASFDLFMNYEDRGRKFKEEVRSL